MASSYPWCLKGGRGKEREHLIPPSPPECLGRYEAQNDLSYTFQGANYVNNSKYHLNTIEISNDFAPMIVRSRLVPRPLPAFQCFTLSWVGPGYEAK